MEVKKMSSQETPLIAFILSLIGGVFILVSGFVLSLWSLYGGLWFNGMMGGMPMMRWFGFPSNLMVGFELVALVSGVLVVIGAIMMRVHPGEHVAWGTIVLVFSITSFLGMGGFMIGALLGIAGGALALSWRPSAKA
jgi:hypothetical protein